MAALVFAVADVAVVAPGSTASAATPSAFGTCQAGWQDWSVPRSAFKSSPFEILAYDGRPAWILGGSNGGVLALDRRGSSWKHVAQGSSGHRGFAGGVALSRTSILGAGYEREPELDFSPIVGRVSGSQLFSRKPPRPTSDQSALADIASLPGGKAWAVGTRLYRGKLLAFATRWDGNRWTYHHPVSGSGAGLLGIDRTRTGQVWAVGWKESSPGRPRPYILRRSGDRWKVVRGPDIGAGTAVLTDVDFKNSKNGWAVGYHVPRGSDRHRAILFRWNGSSWKSVDLPWADDFSALPRSVSVGASGRVLIGGTQLATTKREARGFIATRTGGSWDISVLGVPGDMLSEITDVEATDAGAVAVGTVMDTAVVLRSCKASSPASKEATRRIRVRSIGARRSVDVSDHESSVEIVPGGPAPASKRPSAAASQGFVVRDRTRKAGLDIYTSTYTGFAADLDGNGWKDVFFSRHAKAPFVALNGPDGMKRVSTGTFSAVDRHGCAYADVDKSGAPDIFCAVGRARGRQASRHELSLDPGQPTGSLARDGAGVSDPLGRGRVVAFLHLDDDGFPELFIGSAPTRDDSMPSLNRFYRNEGGTLVPAPGVGLDRAYGAACAWSGDIERDGDQDLAYCTEWRTPSGPTGLRIMRNEGGKLRDRTRKLGVKPMGDIDVAFADVTGDKRKDLIQLSKTRIRVSKWTPKGYKKIWEARVSDAVAVAAADASGDKRADIYIARGTKKQQTPDLLLVSKARGTRYSSVKIPQVSKGFADDVFALDWDKNGLADFVVLNGRGPQGPVKLLASYPR